MVDYLIVFVSHTNVLLGIDVEGTSLYLNKVFVALTLRARLLAYKREVKVKLKVKVKLYCKKVLRWSREDPISTARRDPLYRPLPATTLTLVTHIYESYPKSIR